MARGDGLKVLGMFLFQAGLSWLSSVREDLPRGILHALLSERYALVQSYPGRKRLRKF